ncbi:hypothetical protein M419DRAFT_124424, partial [Trichoderma reesei RUT C-30]
MYYMSGTHRYANTRSSLERICGTSTIHLRHITTASSYQTDNSLVSANLVLESAVTAELTICREETLIRILNPHNSH